MKGFPNDDVLNIVYPDSTVEMDFIEHMDDIDGHYEDTLSSERENVRGRSDAWRVSCDGDAQTVLERRVSSPTILSSCVSSHPLVSEARDQVPLERGFMVRQSNKFSNYVNGDLMARIFPQLFPFGRSHPGECR